MPSSTPTRIAWPPPPPASMFGPVAVRIMAAAIMVSTFGCINGLTLSGARVYYAMAKDKLFFRQAETLNPKTHAPVFSLTVQCIWASLLTLSGRYNDLLDYVIFAVLLFYILTIAGLFVLRRTRPDMERPYKAFGYPRAARDLHVGGGPDRSFAVVVQTELHVAGAHHRAFGPARLLYLAKEGNHMSSNLFGTKSLARIIAESESGEHHLKKTLGPVNLVALGIGAIIGAGLFSLDGNRRRR